jgi:hypothetical protein
LDRNDTFSYENKSDNGVKFFIKANPFEFDNTDLEMPDEKLRLHKDGSCLKSSRKLAVKTTPLQNEIYIWSGRNLIYQSRIRSYCKVMGRFFEM